MVKLRCPGPVGRERLERNVPWRPPRTHQLHKTHTKDQATWTEPRQAPMLPHFNWRDQQPDSRKIPSIIQCIFQSLSAKDHSISGTATTKNTTGTAGTADSSTADAASSNVTAKGNPPAASNANSLFQSQHPLTTDDIAAIVSSIIGTQASKPTHISTDAMDSSSKDLGKLLVCLLCHN